MKLLLLLTTLAASVTASNPWGQPSYEWSHDIMLKVKANEYKDHNCTVKNFRHIDMWSVRETTMDDTSHSVYLFQPRKFYWEFWSNKTHDGGKCHGQYLGHNRFRFDSPCVDLDSRGILPGGAPANVRIKCVELKRWVVGSETLDSYEWFGGVSNHFPGEGGA